MDEDFDSCQYIWSHGMAMRRLLSLLRRSQTYCTDNECLTELPGSDLGASDGNFLFIFCWLFMAIALVVLRSAVFRRREERVKNRDGENDSSGDSSAPPPLC